MKNLIFYSPSKSPVAIHTVSALVQHGYLVADHPSPDVTHLLLPVPSLDSEGTIRGGPLLHHILGDLSESVTIIGGNLDLPHLSQYQKLDLLQDPGYLAENAAITADCAIRVAATKLPTVFRNCPILILGWGRIGKCLSAQLQAAGADVTIAARKESDRAMIQALSFRSERFDAISTELSKYRIIFNTVPSLVLAEAQRNLCRSDCICIELASTPGMEGPGIITARGLPGKYAPESSGHLVAQTIMRLLASGRVLS